MAQWIRVGNRAINMDQVTDVEMAQSSGDVYVHLAVADDSEDGGTVELFLTGEEAAAVRWWIETQAMNLVAYHAADKARAEWLAAQQNQTAALIDQIGEMPRFSAEV